MTDTAPRSKAEEAFIEQYTRKLVVDWAEYQVRRGELPDLDKALELQRDPFNQTNEDGDKISPEGVRARIRAIRDTAGELGMQEPYLSYAREKGWLSKKSWKLTAKGFAVATSFLKR